ncbi:MAG: hypothetical protein LBT20_02625, partial [Clostridiales bacterium]|nr:hypothetical protein [Clostridiales bacterium]
MDKIKLNSYFAVGTVISSAVLFAAFLITVIVAGVAGWWIVLALAPMTVAALILNKDTISKRPRLVKTIERVCFFLAG